MFTAKQLKEMLKNIPDETPIVLQSDEEGNSYRYMNGLEFIANSEESNYYNENDRECLKKSDLEDEERNPKEEGFVLCAVVY